MKQAFDDMHLLIDANAIAAYPVHNKHLKFSQMHLTSNWINALYNMEGQLSTSLAIHQTHIKSIL